MTFSPSYKVADLMGSIGISPGLKRFCPYFVIVSTGLFKRSPRILSSEFGSRLVPTWLISYSISGNGHAPEKVTATDLFYLCSMDRGVANVPYLLAQYLFRHVEGRKSDARLPRGHLIGRLAHHFVLVSNDGLRGLSIVARELPLIDMGELVAAAGAPGAVEDVSTVDEGVQADPTPVQAPLQPPPPPPQRLGRLNEEVQGLRRDVRSLRGLVERLMTDQGRFSIWMITCMTQLMEASGQTYQAFNGTFRGSSPTVFERRTRQRTEDASTSIALQQPDP
ncbi:hypothetical protein Tco_1371541 [Tanacetum coccineum]